MEPSFVKKGGDPIELGLKALRITYKDSVAPNLTLSFINEGEWYASICRYRGSEKIVMHSAKAPNYKDAINIVFAAFLNSAEVFTALRDAIS